MTKADNVQFEPDELANRRKAARRTAIRLAIVAALVFVAFLMTGVIGRT
jgi:hypothetical protein